MVCTFKGTTPNDFLSRANDFENEIKNLLKSDKANKKFSNLHLQNIKVAQIQNIKN